MDTKHSSQKRDKCLQEMIKGLLRSGDGLSFDSDGGGYIFLSAHERLCPASSTKELSYYMSIIESVFINSYRRMLENEELREDIVKILGDAVDKIKGICDAAVVSDMKLNMKKEAEQLRTAVVSAENWQPTFDSFENSLIKTWRVSLSPSLSAFLISFIILSNLSFCNSFLYSFTYCSTCDSISLSPTSSIKSCPN